MKGGDKIKNLFLATRIERSFPLISLVIFSCAFMGKINKEIYLLSICLVLLYSAGGILNALKDKDYELPKYTKGILFIFLIIVLFISTKSQKILLASIAWIVIGITYNLFSRKILLADTTLMGITHYFIPMFFSLLILGEKINISFEISTIIYLTYWLIIPLKNLNDMKKDKNLGYITLPTVSKHGSKITILLYYLSFILIISLYKFLQLNKLYLIMLIPLGIMYLITGKLLSFKNKAYSIPITRLTMVIFTTALTIGSTLNKNFIMSQILFVIFFTLAFIKKYSK